MIVQKENPNTFKAQHIISLANLYIQAKDADKLGFAERLAEVAIRLRDMERPAPKPAE